MHDPVSLRLNPRWMNDERSGHKWEGTLDSMSLQVRGVMQAEEQDEEKGSGGN